MPAPEIRRRLALAWRALRRGDTTAAPRARTVTVDRDELLDTLSLAVLAAGLRPSEPVAQVDWARWATTAEIDALARVVSLLRDAREQMWQEIERGLEPQEVQW